MKNKRLLYSLVSVLFLFVAITILAIVDKTNNIIISLAVQFISILYLFKISWGLILYIKKQYSKHKYSYSIVMNLGLLLFININIIRQIYLLISNHFKVNIVDIYNNTLTSFSFFAILVLPLIIVLAIYSIVTNIILIYKEGFRLQNILGILFGISILLTSIGNQLFYLSHKNIELSRNELVIKRFIDMGLNCVLCYFYCLTIATIYCNIMAARHKPNFDKDFIIVLGSRIRKDGTLTPILKGRVDKAIEFSKEQKEKNNRDIIFIPSGGKGEDEIISEAEAMKNYLIENGIDESNIIVENKSINTYQNMKYSKELIDQKHKGNIIFSTTNYHVFRSGVIANNQGIDCEGIGSTTKWYFYTNALVREFIANLYEQRKEHILIVLIMNICLFLLVHVGYRFNLI